MKNYTNKERQKIYEHLLTLDCPNLLAALVAQRADKTFMHCEASEHTSLWELITNAFLWQETKEGWEFWFEVHECLYAEEYDTPTLPAVIESTEREMFNKATIIPEDDFAPTEITPAKIEINADVSKFKQEMEKVNLTVPQPTRDGESFKEFWTKVKLFFGKWFYKV